MMYNITGEEVKVIREALEESFFELQQAQESGEWVVSTDCMQLLGNAHAILTGITGEFDEE
jgi:hypothetical protein